MTATEFEAKQHLYLYEIGKIDAEIKDTIDSIPEVIRYRVLHSNGSETSEMTPVEATAMQQYGNLVEELKSKLDDLRSKRKTLVENYSALEDSLYNFLAGIE